MVMREYALDVVLAELIPARKIDSPHMRRFFSKHTPGLGGRKALEEVLQETMHDIENQV